MQVRDIMTTNVVSVHPDSSIEDAARLMANHHISGLPVVDNDRKLVGLVTQYDLISKKGTSIADIMTRGIISITPDTELAQVTELLSSRRIRRVPVLENGQIVGVLSRTDLIKQIAQRWVCHVCGEAVHSERVPQTCPRCGANQDAFSQQAMMPGM